MIRLREEVPALGDETSVLDDERRREHVGGAPATPIVEQRAGIAERRRRNSHFTDRTARAVRPWKNSCVLNESPMKPFDFWTICGCLTPIAVCNVDFGRSRAFRTNERCRTPDEPEPSGRAHRGEKLHDLGRHGGVAAAASVNPDARPSSA